MKRLRKKLPMDIRMFPAAQRLFRGCKVSEVFRVVVRNTIISDCCLLYLKEVQQARRL
jgi:hypothetical protein